MEGYIQKRDLCVNCLHATSCTYYRNQTRPVIFCEEFTCNTPDCHLVEIRSLENSKRVSEQSGGNSLCINCLNAGSCNLRKPDEVVYYCEEYR